MSEKTSTRLPQKTKTAAETAAETLKPSPNPESVVIEKQPIAVNTVSVPEEQVDLPSGGYMYPEGSELSKGFVQMKYMTAREEDILTNENFIRQGVVLDKLFESLITSPIKYSDLLIGDRNAIMIAARILSYGSTYTITVNTPSGQSMEVDVDLTELIPKEFNVDNIIKGQNVFTYTLPNSGNVIKFKLLTVQDERDIDNTLKAWKKIKRSGNLTARLRQMILSVNGDENKGHIAQWIDNNFLVSDTRAFRKYVNEIQPNLDFELELVDEETGNSFRQEFTPGLDFFWPDARI